MNLTFISGSYGFDLREKLVAAGFWAQWHTLKAEEDTQSLGLALPEA